MVTILRGGLGGQLEASLLSWSVDSANISDDESGHEKIYALFPTQTHLTPNQHQPIFPPSLNLPDISSNTYTAQFLLFSLRI
ncbi:hypothetical protein L1987_66950 [Smallanthus sonchifolius]|uniref:Uncharacterized protein n=1 Tax=Smallanthus sonchifolius TaxID=185202 RepID=A0ACB9BYJ4_9ASTR|nr:hypothetical protein L1987_66950 [Smallanthus sonchifolius]